jgi:hypothetical protein
VRVCRRGLGALLAWILAAGLGGAAWADAIVERTMRSDGFGGLGAFEGQSVETTSGVAQRNESTFKFTGGFLSAIQRMAGVGDSVRITRVDRGVVWALDPDKKTYTESPLTLRLEQERRGPGTPPPRPERREASDVVVTRSEFKVERTGAHRTINGFPCEEYLATWLVETRNQKTGETAKSLMTTHVWTTPETAEIGAVQAQEQAYARAYLQRIQADFAPDRARNLGMAAMFGATGLGDEEQRKALAKLGAEMSKIHGYWISTQVAWTAEGDGARTGEGAPARPDDLGSALGKLFGGGGSKGGEASRDGQRPLFTLQTEVRSLKIVPGDPSRFEIPAGYTLKK